jgi:hypothetical protein
MINPTQTTIMTPTGSGQILVSDGSGVASWNSVIDLNADVIEFMELVLVALGHDIKFDDFSKMTKKEKLAILRDIKIKSVLK